MVVAAAEEEEEERRSFVAVAGSRWFGWEVVASRVGSESMVVAVAAEAGSTDGSCHSNAGLGGGGYCTPAAMATRAATVGRSLSCVLAGATVVARVAEVGRSWRCMEVVGLGCLEGEEGSSALRRSSRLLPCLNVVS